MQLNQQQREQAAALVAAVEQAERDLRDARQARNDYAVDLVEAGIDDRLASLALAISMSKLYTLRRERKQAS